MTANTERLAFLEGRVVEHATHIEGVREAIANLDGKVSRQFTWLVGIQLTTLVTIIAVLLSR